MMNFAAQNWRFESVMPALGERRGDELVIEKEFTAMARWQSEKVAIEPGKYYAFCVECAAEGVRSSVAPYAMLYFMDEGGRIFERAYAVNADERGTLKKLSFRAQSGWTSLMVEVGLRGAGKARFGMPSLRETEAPAPRRKLRVASTLLQSKPTCAETLRDMEAMVDRLMQAEKPDLIVFSEALYDHAAGLSYQESSETTDGVQCRAMSAKAKQYGVHILIDMHERDAQDRLYNTAVLFDREGRIEAKYSKSHLTTAEYEEGLTPGDELPVFDTEFGRVGILICWDAYFPEPARVLGLKGAEVILIPTVGDPGFRHISRAKENGVYVVGCGVKNETKHGVMPCRVISPSGKILAQTEEYGAAAVAEIDLSDHDKVFWLSVPDAPSTPENIYRSERRPELYGLLTRF